MYANQRMFLNDIQSSHSQ